MGEVYGGLTPWKGPHPRAGQGLLSLLEKQQYEVTITPLPFSLHQWWGGGRELGIK